MRKKPLSPPRWWRTSIAFRVISLRPGRSVAADLAPEGSLVRFLRLSGRMLRSIQTGRLERQKMPRAFSSLGMAARAVLFQLTV